MGHGHHRQRSRFGDYDFEVPLPQNDPLAEVLDFEERHILEYDEIGSLEAAIDSGERPPASVKYPPRRLEYLGQEDRLESALIASRLLHVDGEYDPKANSCSPSILQRGGGIGRHKVNAYGQSIPIGGGSSSGRRIKEQPPKLKLVVQAPEREEVVEHFSVYGLTLGERLYYQERPGLACEVLTAAAMAIDAGHRFERTAPSTGFKPKHDFDVYGLRPLHAYILNVYDGDARRALSIFAHERDGERIRLRDGVAA